MGLKLTSKQSLINSLMFIFILGLFILIYAVWSVYRLQYNKITHHLKSEVMFLSEILESNLQQHNYTGAKNVLINWNERFKDKVARISLKLNNNFSLIQIENCKNPKYYYFVKKCIPYSYSGKSYLNVVFNLDNFNKILLYEMIVLCFSVLFFILMLLILLYFYRKSKKTEETANLYLNVASVIIIAMNDKLTITLVNRKACEILGYEQGEILGKNVVDTIIPFEERKSVRNILTSIVKGNEETFEYNINHVITKNGEKRLIEWYNKILKDDSGKNTGIISSGQDITEKKHLENQILQSQKMESIGRLAGGIAHDFNNILTGIMGNIELALNFTNDDKSTRFLEAAYERCEKAANLVKQILGFSRKQMVVLSILNLNEELKRIYKTLKRLIDENIKFELSLNKNPLIKADETQIEQIIYNLVLNARDAVNENKDEAKKHILIKTDTVKISDKEAKKFLGIKPGEYAVISVSDNGIGMEKEVVDKIFEPFFTTKGIGKGTGLGLSTVYGILKQNKGYITVESRKGKGTVFYVYWPLFKESESTQNVVKEDSLENGTLNGNETVLLVEDDKTLRKVLKEGLESLGYKIVTAENGNDALKKLEDYQLNYFDVIVTDIVMPEMNGEELAKKAFEKNKNFKVIFISGYSDIKNKLKELFGNKALFLQKPFSPKKLAKKIRILMG